VIAIAIEADAAEVAVVDALLPSCDLARRKLSRAFGAENLRLASYGQVGGNPRESILSEVVQARFVVCEEGREF